MRSWRLLLPAVAVLALGTGGYVAFGWTLVPVPLASDAACYVPAAPEPGEDQAVLEAVMPPGPSLDAFLANQSDLTVLAPAGHGGWVGQLVDRLQRSRNGRVWRMTFKPGVRLQDGSRLAAGSAAAVLAPEADAAGAVERVVDGQTLEWRFRRRTEGVPALLARCRIPGSGPFLRRGTTLQRYDGFMHGRAGIAGLRVVTDPAALAGSAWAEGLASGRWAWAAYPGKVDPSDMARVRLAPYDQVRLSDGSVWFLSRKLRRFRPDRGAWPDTRLFGVWRGSMDLPLVGAPETP